MAVLPTPGSPISTALFLRRRARISTVCSISPSRPMTGSMRPARGLGGQVAAELVERGRVGRALRRGGAGLGELAAGAHDAGGALLAEDGLAALSAVGEDHPDPAGALAAAVAGRDAGLRVGARGFVHAQRVLGEGKSQSAPLRFARSTDSECVGGHTHRRGVVRISRAVAWPRGRPPPSCPQRSGSWTGPRVDFPGARTRSSSTTGRTRRCCGRRARRCCACSSRRTRAMNSSLHSLAATSSEPDLGAFLYALRRLPAGIWRRRVIAIGQEAEAFARAGIGRIEDWEAVEAPARRRRWYDSGTGTLAVLLACDLRPRRRDPDARRLPARVEQAARAAAAPADCRRPPTPPTRAERSAAPRTTGRALREAWPASARARSSTRSARAS